MNDPQFKKINSWFRTLNQKVGGVRKEVKNSRKDLENSIYKLDEKMDFKFERVYRELDGLKIRMSDLENNFEKYTRSEQHEIKIFRLALSKLEDRLSALES